MALFKKMDFKSHAGKQLDWKIECDALTDEDLETIAYVISKKISFSQVVGIPRGGLRLANELEAYGEICADDDPAGITLIVDDVLTTGKSMEEARKEHPNSAGVVIFARGPVPEWIWPVFQCGE